MNESFLATAKQTSTRINLIATLRLMGIAKLKITYSGSGDSGQMDSVSAYMAEGDDDGPFSPQTVSKNVDDLYEHLDPDEIIVRVANKLMNVKDKPLSEQLESLGYDLLEEVGIGDWVNNEGGQGEIVIYPNRQAEDDPAGPQIEIDHEQNVTITEDYHYEL